MVRARRFTVALVAALVLALAAGPVALAAGADESVTFRIFADYSRDHVINGSWSPSELQAALGEAKRTGSGYEEFQQAVQNVYDRELGGLRTNTGADGQTAGPPTSGSALLPEPRGPGDRDQPPWPFLALTGLAALLVVSGAGSSIYRRVNR